MFSREDSADSEGFTLIELLVVMIIIGVLAAIAVPTFLAQRTKAFDSQARADVRAAQNEIETYRAGSQTLPDSVTWATSSPAGATTVTVKRSKDVPADASSLLYLSSGDSYCVSVHSRSGNWLAIASDRAGVNVQTAACSSATG
ncbi:type II secretion system protein [Kineococcus endophyticus]|uniref:Type II secretion system protein n=1 Tax=Kineococcus endophyticus TaxID=1181883 RepID=A0ABV3PAL5_9ACTN